MTNKREWSEVDSYFAKTLIGSDPALEEALAANATAGLPSIDVSTAQGKLIHLLARMSGARKALEIGALGGYSTIWLARALPDDGRLITLEVSAKHAEVARRNVARAGVGGKRLLKRRVRPDQRLGEIGIHLAPLAFVRQPSSPSPELSLTPA